MLLFRLLQDRHAGFQTELFQSAAIAALNAFQGAGHVIGAGRVDGTFQLGAVLEVDLGILRPAQFQQGQTAEIKATRVLGMPVNGGREQLMCLQIVLREIGVNTVAV